MIFRRFLLYLYGAPVDKNVGLESICELMLLADRYSVDSLKVNITQVQDKKKVILFWLLGSLRANINVNDWHRQRYLHAWHFRSLQRKHFEGELLVVSVTTHRTHQLGNLSRAFAGSASGSVRFDSVEKALHNWRLDSFVFALRRPVEVATHIEVTVKTIEISQPQIIAKLSQIAKR